MRYMPKPVTVAIDVPRSVDEVFEYLDVMANHEPFNDHLMRDWELSGPSRGVGSRARVHVRALGMRDVIDIEVMDAERPVRIVERSGHRCRTLTCELMNTHEPKGRMPAGWRERVGEGPPAGEPLRGAGGQRAERHGWRGASR